MMIKTTSNISTIGKRAFVDAFSPEIFMRAFFSCKESIASYSKREYTSPEPRLRFCANKVPSLM